MYHGEWKILHDPILGDDQMFKVENSSSIFCGTNKYYQICFIEFPTKRSIELAGIAAMEKITFKLNL